MTCPSEAVLAWVLSVAGAPVITVEGLCDGANPWLLLLRGSGPWASVVLRTGGSEQGVRERFETEAAALESALERGVNAPRLIAVDIEGEEAGVPAVVTTVVPGSSRIARSRISGGYFLGAGMPLILPRFESLHHTRNKTRVLTDTKMGSGTRGAEVCAPASGELFGG